MLTTFSPAAVVPRGGARLGSVNKRLSAIFYSNRCAALTGEARQLLAQGQAGAAARKARQRFEEAATTISWRGGGGASPPSVFDNKLQRR